MYVYFIYNNEVIYFMIFSLYLYLLAFSVSIVLSCSMAYGSIEIVEARQEGDQQEGRHSREEDWKRPVKNLFMYAKFSLKRKINHLFTPPLCS